MDDSAIDAAHTLADPVRHRLYEYVIDTGREVGRAEAAEALGIQRTLAAHHLDRLAQAGLLVVERRKLSGREGPGSGRPAKLYRRSDREMSLHLPPREYELAAHVLAEAVERHGAEEALHTAAREEGHRIGAQNGELPLAEVLRSRGYAPGREEGEGGRTRLHNCPFHSLARAFPPMACGLNLELLRGLLAGHGDTDVRAELDPREDGCCVVLSKNKKH